MATERYVTIHGHFYQPPRENPWLEAVETQDSAHPYHDWNERITAECYGANAAARILDARDRILKIVNNYTSISFNFGPTLLSWLEDQAPETYRAVLDADRQSRARFGGHGSAIAQTYNHMILPLANARDKQTQVRWGVRDFERRFGRKPEGMWLAETAVDVASLEALAAEGIAFTILEPHQARRHRYRGTETWQDGIGDTRLPYVCRLPSGRSIAIFFYDGPISRAVAFEQLLTRGEYLANRLASAFPREQGPPRLVNIATDGETYGHHHPYGEMALAYALEYIEKQELAKLTNYAEFLALHPPQHEVEIVEDTSWSCAHGVERWRSDCGCNAAAPQGWNQRWRGPLRDALDWLRGEVSAIFEDRGRSLLRDPWAARDDYIELVLDRNEDSIRRFMTRHALGGAPTPILELLEMQRAAMLMYTSCGWFFNDISGIETVQILFYAGRAIQLAEKISGRQLEKQFTEILDQARSNIPERGSGRDIYAREVAPARIDLQRVAAHYAAASLFDNFDDEALVYAYRVTRRDFDIFRAGRARMGIASINVASLVTLEEQSFDLAVLHLGETELTGGVRIAQSDEDYHAVKEQLADTFKPGGIPPMIRLLDRHFSEGPVSIRSLFKDEQRRILNLICNATLEEAESAFRQLHERYDPLVRFLSGLGIPLPRVLQTAAEFDLNVQLRRLLESNDPPLAEVESLLRESKDERVALDETTVMALERAIERASAAFASHPENVDLLENHLALVTLVRTMQLSVNMRRAQNDYYGMQATVRPVFAANGHAAATKDWLAKFDALGEKLSMSPEARH